MTISLAQQMRCIERELTLRHLVYPKRVAAGKMKPADADREIAAMAAVLKTLSTLPGAHAQESLFD
jgi:hypothetical protein